MSTFAQKSKLSQQIFPSKSTIPGRSYVGQSRTVNSILPFRHTIGNQSLQRLLRNDTEERNAVFTDMASHDAAHPLGFDDAPIPAPKPISAQPKHALGKPNETYEQERESREAVHGYGTDEIAILQPPESRDSRDVVLSRELPDREHALAVTLGRAIQVHPDAFRLSKSELEGIIAHETVHVAQQSLPGRPGTRSELEQEANDLAPQALAGGPVRPQVPASPTTALREERTIGTGTADQQTWVSRIDDLIRLRFRLTGVPARMTGRGRVQFQDVGAFGRGFGNRPRDLLVEAFLERSDLMIDWIRDFYNFHVYRLSTNALAETQRFVDAHMGSGFRYFNNQVLTWTDYGLTGSASDRFFSDIRRVPGSSDMVTAQILESVTREQAENAVRRQPGVRYRLAEFYDWPQNPQQPEHVIFTLQIPASRVTSRISAGEILARTSSGVTSSGARGSRRIRIQSTPAQPGRPAARGRPETPTAPARPANVSTLVHEACHFYTHDNFIQFANSVRSAETTFQMPRTMSIRTPLSSARAITTSESEPMRLAPILKEGFTEYFTQRLMQEQTAALGPVGTASYPSQYEAARLIINSLRPPSAAESAYFHGISADIQKVRNGIPVVERYPLNVRVEPGAGADEIEEALGRARGPARQSPSERERMRPRTLQDIQGR